MYCVEHYLLEPAIEYPADYMAPAGKDFETETQLLSQGSFLTSVGLAYQAFSDHLRASYQEETDGQTVPDLPQLQDLFLKLLSALATVTPDQMVRATYELSYGNQEHDLGLRVAIDPLGHYSVTFYHEAYGQDYNEEYVLEQTNEYRVRWNQCIL